MFRCKLPSCCELSEVLVFDPEFSKTENIPKYVLDDLLVESAVFTSSSNVLLDASFSFSRLSPWRIKSSALDELCPYAEYESFVELNRFFSISFSFIDDLLDSAALCNKSNFNSNKKFKLINKIKKYPYLS